MKIWSSFSIFLYSTRIKKKMAPKYLNRELPWNLPVHRSPIQGTAMTKQSDAKKEAGYYAIKVWLRQQLAFLSLNPGLGKDRFPEVAHQMVRPWLSTDSSSVVIMHLCDSTPYDCATKQRGRLFFPEHLIISFKLSLKLENRIKKVSTCCCYW